jgi:hypothetical protein
MPLVDQAVRRDDAVLVRKRRHAPVEKFCRFLSTSVRRRRTFDSNFDGHAVVGLRNRLAERLVALGNRERRCGGERRAAGDDAACKRAAAPRKLRRAGFSIAGAVWTAEKLAAEDSTGGAELTNLSTTVPDPASRFVDMVATLLRSMRRGLFRGS